MMAKYSTYSYTIEIPLIEALAIDRLVILRMRRDVINKLMNGFPPEDLAIGLLRLYVSMTHPYSKTYNQKGR